MGARVSLSTWVCTNWEIDTRADRTQSQCYCWESWIGEKGRIPSPTAFSPSSLSRTQPSSPRQSAGPLQTRPMEQPLWALHMQRERVCCCRRENRLCLSCALPSALASQRSCPFSAGGRSCPNEHRKARMSVLRACAGTRALISLYWFCLHILTGPGLEWEHQ